MTPNPQENEVADFRVALQRLGGSRELLCDLINFFREDIGPLLDKIEQGAANGDMKATRLASHSVKGLAASFDADRVVDLAAKIESASDHGKLAEVDSLLKQLRDEVSRLLRAFDAYES